MSVMALPRTAAEVIVNEVSAWGNRGVETGGFLLCREQQQRLAAVVALSASRGIGRTAGELVVSGKALAALFGHASEHELSIRAQFHSHRRSAFLSTTDLRHGFNVEGFITTVVPHFAAPSENPCDWGWWMYRRGWEEIKAPALLGGSVQIIRFDEDGVREG